MSEVTTALEGTSIPPEGEKARLLTLDHLDGRTLAVRRVKAIEGGITADLGGDDIVSEAQRALCRRAAVLDAVLEHAEAQWAAGNDFDLAQYLATVNAQRRVLATLGLERRAKTVRGLVELMDDDA